MWGKFLLLAAALALLTETVSAQNYSGMPNINVPSGDQRSRLMQQRVQEQRGQKKLDDAYKAATKKAPDQKPNDPWGDVRPASPAPTIPASKKKPQ